jgi:chaperonin GroES
MRLRPLQDRVLIRRAEPETKSAGGIFIPDSVQEKPVEGEIVAVGPAPAAKTAHSRQWM